MDYILNIPLLPIGVSGSTKSLNTSIVFTSFPGNTDIESSVNDAKALFADLFTTNLTTVNSIGLDAIRNGEEGYLLQINLTVSGQAIGYNKFFTSRPGSTDVEAVMTDARSLFSDLFGVPATGEAVVLQFILGS